MKPFQLVKIYIERMDEAEARDLSHMRRTVLRALPADAGHVVADRVDELFDQVSKLGRSLVDRADATLQRRSALEALDRLQAVCQGH